MAAGCWWWFVPRRGSPEAAPPTAAPGVRRSRSLDACEKLHVAFTLGFQPRTSTTSRSIEICEEPKAEETCAPGPPPPGKLAQRPGPQLGNNWLGVGFLGLEPGNHASEPRGAGLSTENGARFRAERTRKG